MATVAVNPPKTPVTKGSNGVAVAAVPNVCKMPGPPAPFVPTPLPNIGKSSDKPDGYTKNVKVEGKIVAIKGATFGSMGDMASKGTGGGLISANTHGPTAFVAPGSMDVSFEGKAVHLLSDATTNNNGSPPNASTPAVVQPPTVLPPFDLNIDCSEKKNPTDDSDPWDDCMVAQLCTMVDEVNKIPKEKLEKLEPSPRGTKPYNNQLYRFKRDFAQLVKKDGPDAESVKSLFYDPPPPNSGCVHKKWKENGAKPKPSGRGTGKFNPDHTHPASLDGDLVGLGNLKWAEARVNMTAGPAMEPYDPKKHGKMTASKCCT